MQILQKRRAFNNYDALTADNFMIKWRSQPEMKTYSAGYLYSACIIFN